jgi:uncharacterized cupin superfamily protein
LIRLNRAACQQTGYPPPFNQAVQGRWYRRLAPAGGLTEFGVSHVVLKPGARSSQRHWHNGEDEFLDARRRGGACRGRGQTISDPRSGDLAAWPKGSTNGHHLINESHAPCRFIVIGCGENTGGGYSDIDMLFTDDGRYVHKDGTPYEATKRPA